MAQNMNGLSLELIIHPGETLREILEDRKMSQKELAARVALTEAYISNVINGQKAISVSLAKKLEYALGIDASFWINLQANYDKELADFEDFNRSERKKRRKVVARIHERIAWKRQNFIHQHSRKIVNRGTILVMREEPDGMPLTKMYKTTQRSLMRRCTCREIARALEQAGVKLPARFIAEWDEELQAWVGRREG